MENGKNTTSKNRGQEVKGFFIHLAVSVAVISGLAALNLTAMHNIGGYTFYWFLFPLAFLSWRLLWHALGVFVFTKRDAMKRNA